MTSRDTPTGGGRPGGMIVPGLSIQGYSDRGGGGGVGQVG